MFVRDPESEPKTSSLCYSGDERFINTLLALAPCLYCFRTFWQCQYKHKRWLRITYERWGTVTVNLVWRCNDARSLPKKVYLYTRCLLFSNTPACNFLTSVRLSYTPGGYKWKGKKLRASTIYFRINYYIWHAAMQSPSFPFLRLEVQIILAFGWYC